MEDEDLFGQGTGEARDSVSTLPKKIAVQVTLELLSQMQCYASHVPVLAGNRRGTRQCDHYCQKQKNEQGRKRKKKLCWYLWCKYSVKIYVPVRSGGVRGGVLMCVYSAQEIFCAGPCSH